MASITNPFYIGVITLNRDEAALVLTLLLGALVQSDGNLDRIGKSVGGVTEVRQKLMAIGADIDDNWDEMVRLAEMLYK